MQTVDYRNNKRLLQEGVSFHWWDAPHTSLHNHNHYEVFYHYLRADQPHPQRSAEAPLQKRPVFDPSGGLPPVYTHRGKPLYPHQSASHNGEAFQPCAKRSASASMRCSAGKSCAFALNDVELAFFQSRAQQLNLIARSAEEPDRLSVLVICEMLVHAISLLYQKMAAFFRRLPRMDAGSLAKDPLARIYFLQRSRCLSFGRLLAPCRHPVFSTVYRRHCHRLPDQG